MNRTKVQRDLLDELPQMLQNRQKLGKILQECTQGYSWCHRCYVPWKFVNGHVTSYSITSGCFPLCHHCWEELKIPELRLPYYEEIWRGRQQFEQEDMEIWERIKTSVMKGN